MDQAAVDLATVDAPAPIDMIAAKCGCQAGQICVRYFDGTCQPLGFKCRSLPSSCFPSVCGSCAKLACGDLDGNFWMCGNSCSPPDSYVGSVPPFDVGCYGP